MQDVVYRNRKFCPELASIILKVYYWTMTEHFSKRIYTVKMFYYHTCLFFSCSGKYRKAARKENLDPQFVERIMLAVTQVNGCRLCSYAHTRIALERGVDNDEITQLLGGDLESAPKEEYVALLFAQHYAETGGNPDTATLQNMISTYGKERTLAVLYHIRTIMFGNIYGNTLDGFYHRIRGRGSKASSPFRELVIILGILPAAAVLLIYKVIRKVIRQEDRLYRTIQNLE